MLLTTDSRDFFWSTVGLEPDAAVRRWEEVLSDGIVPMEVSSLIGEGFEAAWRRYGIGPVDLNFLQAKPQRVHHALSSASQSADDSYELLFVRSGSLEFKHQRRQVKATTGSIVLLDNARPYDLEMNDPVTDCFAVHLPDVWLRKWIPYPKDIIASPITAVNGWGAPLVALLETISTLGLEQSPMPRGVVADQLGSLIAMLIASQQEVRQDRHRDELLRKLKQTLADRSHEGGLTPEVVAQQNGISKRYLHLLFAQAGTTFSKVLLDIRLDKASVLLRDRRYDRYQMSDIAWDCGFVDQSHFARTFKRRFLRSPLEYRKTEKLGDG